VPRYYYFGVPITEPFMATQMYLQAARKNSYCY
jgi:hypothetical protein